ncbi:MAG: hypothetical protein RLZZ22_514 [Pseudomonadota bacterium]|jgi:uncharacterized protein (DUF58 family)
MPTDPLPPDIDLAGSKRHLRQPGRNWQNWWLRRQPTRDSLELTQRNLYILPTRAGLMLALTLLVMLVGSINYQLNLGYLLTFLLAGCAAVALHLTHANLNGLRLQLRAGEPVHAGQAALLTVTLHNPGRRARYGLALGWLGPGMTEHGDPPSVDWSDLPAQSQATRQLRCTLLQRGRHALPALQIQGRFPLGIFRAWCWWRPAALQLVYPAPEVPAPPLPAPSGQRESPTRTARNGNSDEWEGLRPWRRGDPLKWVAWKKVAQQAASESAPWISREFNLPPDGRCWLDQAQTGLADTERRLSRLCAWVLAAEARGLDYGLRLEQLEIAPDHGPAHRLRCLEALALC